MSQVLGMVVPSRLKVTLLQESLASTITKKYPTTICFPKKFFLKKKKVPTVLSGVESADDRRTPVPRRGDGESVCGAVAHGAAVGGGGVSRGDGRGHRARHRPSDVETLHN